MKTKVSNSAQEAIHNSQRLIPARLEGWTYNPDGSQVNTIPLQFLDFPSRFHMSVLSNPNYYRR